jgi:hypothetical protein
MEVFFRKTGVFFPIKLEKIVAEFPGQGIILIEKMGIKNSCIGIGIIDVASPMIFEFSRGNISVPSFRMDRTIGIDKIIAGESVFTCNASRCGEEHKRKNSTHKCHYRNLEI